MAVGHRVAPFLPAVAWLVLCHCAGESTATGGDPPHLIGSVAAAGIPRTIEPRLSVPLSYRTCRPADSAGTAAYTTCGLEADATPSSAVLDLAGRASQQLRAQADPDALHAAALIDLAWAGNDGISLQRSVSYLQTASRLSSRSAAILTNLAAALLVRAERHQQPRDLMEAIETADRALELDPRSAAARFNLALGLERLNLDAQAARAWTAFLQVDSVSEWADEVRRRPRPSHQPPDPPEPPTDAARSDIAAYVDLDPVGAMFVGWDRTLEQWGEATLANDSVRADRLLNFADAIGEELKNRGRDASLADAVRDITRLKRHSSARSTAARLHRDYSAGLRAYRGGEAAAAGRWFERVAAAPATSPPLKAWARYHRAATLVQQGRAALAEKVLQEALAEVDTLRYPLLAGRIRWVMATLALRGGRYERAIQAARSAAPLLARAGESDNVGAVQTIEADAEQYLPDRTDLYAVIHRSLTTLHRYRRSIWLHNALYNTARVAGAERMPRLALQVQNEGLEVAESIGQPLWIAEARIARARLLTAAGQFRQAEADLNAARPLVAQLVPGARDWFQADLRFSEALTALSRDPRRALEAADSAVHFFESQQNQIRLLPVLVTRARASLALGNVAAATADLDRVLGLLDQQKGDIASIDLRASLVEGARQVADQLVTLQVGSGHDRKALEALERARVSLAPVHQRGLGAAGIPPSVPAGHVAVEYALIGDTLLLWTVSKTSVRLERREVERERLARTIERVRAALELRTAEPTMERDLMLLYDWLIRPVRGQLGEAGTPLLVVTDREIGGVPFAALRDSSANRYLIEEHPLRFASSLRDAGVSRVAGARSSELLLVADPAFDRSSFPGLARLPGAAAEAQAIAAQYPASTLLRGPAASRHAFETAMKRSGIIHYAGHAVFDDERPNQSLLVLASDSASDAGPRLTAAEIERFDLTSVRLVVLSACETIRSRTGRTGGFAGLARAFLAAGAGGVVGSLWRVEDRPTQELMEAFHRAYRQSGDGAAALRAAQLELIGSGDSALSSPYAWAGFRYAGN
jgi:CHAT domain-containing protein